MFWFFKQKPLNVYFYTARERAFMHAKPKRASAFVPQWFKNLPPPSFSDNPEEPLRLQTNLKSCPGFMSLYSSGFMLPLWSDLHIEVNPNNYRYQFLDGESKISSHPAFQFGACPITKNYIHLKLENPWLIHTDKNVNLLFTAPVWNEFGYDDFVTVPGAYSASSVNIDANINLFVKRSEKRTIHSLLLGQPLAHVIPITERPIKLHHELVTEAELKKLGHKSPMLLMDGDRYKRAIKMCPHGK